MLYEIIKESKIAEPKISVIVPVYNVISYIDETISSLLKQTLKDIEIILVDDGSSDGSFEKIVEYGDRFDNICVAKEPNAGPGMARNNGLSIAKGKYISFVDSDDLLPERALEIMYEAAEREQVGVVTGISVSFNSNRSWFIGGHYNKGVFKSGRKTLIQNPEMLYTLGPCNKLYLREVVEDIRFPDSIKVAEDHPFVIEAYLKSQSIYTVDEIIYNYRAREDEGDISLSQIVTSNPYVSFKDIIASIKLSDALLKEYVTNPVALQKIRVDYHDRIIATDIWPAYKGILLNGDAETQIKMFDAFRALVDSMDFHLFNNLGVFQRLLTFETINRYTFIKEKARPSYLRALRLAYEKLDPGSLNKLLSSDYAKEVRAGEKAAKRNSIKPIYNRLVARKLKATISTGFEKVVVKNWTKLVGLSRNFYARRIAFPIYKLGKKERKIIFLTNKHDVLADSFKAVYDEIILQKPDYKVVGYLKQPQRTILELLKMYKDIATAEYIFLDDYYRQIYGLTLRKDSEVIQLWHAAGAFKKFGFSSIGYADSNTESFERDAHKNYSKVVVSSSEIVPFYAEAFDVDEKNVLPLGVPRTDRFFNEEYKAYIKNVFEGKYPALKNKKVITYAPTFRGGPGERQQFVMNLNIRRLAEQLGDEYVLVLKMHPSVVRGVGIPFDLQEFAFNMSNEDINDVLINTDILITDYSSVVFDFSIMEKPVLFYAYDLEGYLGERNFYYNYEEFVPGPIVRTNEELIGTIKANDFDLEKVRVFKERFFDDLDGNSAKRIVKELIK
ncbi:glycosyltransferase [Listeria monocytogenes]|uniref:bifunctional glycosyltransferase/CDP-glycerol:glycerophosphate glycerophosphotransferase n=1 Tax=Listeria monocytogenes TaxID=1639 RepID=UPI000F25D64F|nr:CDP-glycerol glycerophosphotransferase family protein [Listeria monocytogenes]EKT8892851.1 CDP-glycerol glycerophosphotransferase family protein [Listeria monocytogenes]TYU06782.1 glycosyltransferase [Listeria monocytogenes]